MSTDDSEGFAKREGDPKPKEKTSLVRNVIGVVLLVTLAGAATMEFLANQRYNNAVAKLGMTNAVMPTQEQAEKLIGKKPDGPMVKDNDSNEQRATYSWQGLRHKYVLKVLYTMDKMPIVVRLEPE